MACSATKGRQAAPAMDLYQGVMYSTFRANVPAARPAVVILSARHGFIESGRVIEPYEQRMTEARADEMIAELRGFDSIEWPTGVRSIMLAGGKTYQRVMRAAIKRRIELGLLNSDVIIEQTSGGIGYQRAQLGAYLRNLEDLTVNHGQEPTKYYNVRLTDKGLKASMPENAMTKATEQRDPRSLNALKEASPATAQIQMRVTPDRKNRYVRQAQAEGLKLTDWIQKHMDRVCNEAGQPDTTMYRENGDNNEQK